MLFYIPDTAPHWKALRYKLGLLEKWKFSI